MIYSDSSISYGAEVYVYKFLGMRPEGTKMASNWVSS